MNEARGVFARWLVSWLAVVFTMRICNTQRILENRPPVLRVRYVAADLCFFSPLAAILGAFWHEWRIKRRQ